MAVYERRQNMRNRKRKKYLPNAGTNKSLCLIRGCEPVIWLNGTMNMRENAVAVAHNNAITYVLL